MLSFIFLGFIRCCHKSRVRCYQRSYSTCIWKRSKKFSLVL